MRLAVGMDKLKYLLISLVLLVVADGLITQNLIASGFATEGNPLIQTIVMEHYFPLLKLAGAMLAAFLLWKVARRQPKLAATVIAFFVCLYTGIVYWNVGIFVIASF